MSSKNILTKDTINLVWNEMGLPEQQQQFPLPQNSPTNLYALANTNNEKYQDNVNNIGNWVWGTWERYVLFS